MIEEKCDCFVTVLTRKKNIILQEAPSVGKTYVAKRLAYSMMGEKDDDRIKDLNREIAKDKSLSKGFCIGHSYFGNKLKHSSNS